MPQSKSTEWYSISAAVVSHKVNLTELCSSSAAVVLQSRDLTKLRRRRQGERQKNNRFNEQNNNSARASRISVHFFAVPAEQRREMTTF